MLNWSHNAITLIIAVSAFGLGVNKADVRHNHHIGVPESLEAWSQKLGQGGRDGSKCEVSIGPSQTISVQYIIILVLAATILYDRNFQTLEF